MIEVWHCQLCKTAIPLGEDDDSQHAPECPRRQGEAPQANVGRKDANGKLRYGLLPAAAIRAVVRVLGFGAKKYGDRNWAMVADARNRYYDAAQRHLTAWWEGEAFDKDTGESHLAHAACCVLFLLDGIADMTDPAKAAPIFSKGTIEKPFRPGSTIFTFAVICPNCNKTVERLVNPLVDGDLKVCTDCEVRRSNLRSTIADATNRAPLDKKTGYCKRCDKVHEALGCGCTCVGDGKCHKDCGCGCPSTCGCWVIENQDARAQIRCGKPSPSLPTGSCDWCGTNPKIDTALCQVCINDFPIDSYARVGAFGTPTYETQWKVRSYNDGVFQLKRWAYGPSDSSDFTFATRGGLTRWVDADEHPTDSDDAERLTCLKQGRPGHRGCGRCVHGGLTAHCPTCFFKPPAPEVPKPCATPGCTLHVGPGIRYCVSHERFA